MKNEINYMIRATVTDITQYTPKAADTFLVDTNVWFWMTYSKASISAKQYQKELYPAFVNSSLVAGSTVCRSGLSMAELAHLIEKTEFEIKKRVMKSLTLKEFRHNYPDERSWVIKEVQAAWGQVKSIADLLVLTIDESTIDDSLISFQSIELDGYDLFVLKTMRLNGVVRIITDDGDFATVPGIQVFTANHNVIESARRQGKLQKFRD